MTKDFIPFKEWEAIEKRRAEEGLRKRPSWDEYFARMARFAASRSTCSRTMVGCILVRDRRVLATGYNGSVRGQPHCIDVGCDIDPQTNGCRRTVHAEMNALAQAAIHGVSTVGATCYTNISPCWWCFRTLINAGIVRFCFIEEYRIPLDREFASQCGVSCDLIVIGG